MKDADGGHIVSTLVGDANRNGSQQRKAGWLGGPGYDGGHAAPSALGFIGERGGIFPRHEWQNRKAGTENDDTNVHEIEMDVIREAKIRLEEGSAPDLTWEMELVPGKKPGVPDSMELSYAFGDEEVSFERFNTSPATRVRLVAMRNNFLNSEALVIDGLQRLSHEAYGPEGFARGSDEVIHVLIHRGSRTMGYGYLIAGAQKTSRGLKGGKDEFSREALHDWLDECRDLAYSPGIGTWTTAEVHVFPDKPGRLDFFEEERLRKMSNGRWYPGAEPADAVVWTKQLLRYPRTADSIPSWMWDVFRAEGVTPPIYNPEFASVDWNNRRRPVTERGTDFTVEPTVIDPSLEPGVFTKISKKLFGA